MDRKEALSENSAVKAEAEAWITRLDGDEPLSNEEQDELRQWLSQSPAHQQEIVGAYRLWTNQLLVERTSPFSQTHTKFTRPNAFELPWWRRSFGACVSIAVVFLLAGLFVFMPDPMSKTNGSYETAIGQQRTVQLADGSAVELNTDTHIEVDYTSRSRNIRLLKGEAHFDVASNKQKPFRVFSAKSKVQAVGTAFSMYLRDDALDVLVTEGRVGVSTPAFHQVNTQHGQNTAVSLEPSSGDNEFQQIGFLDENQMVSLVTGTAFTEVKPVSNLNVVTVDKAALKHREAWRRGVLIFNGERLVDVVDEIGRYTTLSIELIDPEVLSLQIGGRYQIGDTRSFFRGLEQNFNLDVEYYDYNRVRVKSK